MNRKSRPNKDARVRPAVKPAVLISVAVASAACDGANQGVQIGTGQNPDPVVIDFPIAPPRITRSPTMQTRMRPIHLSAFFMVWMLEG